MGKISHPSPSNLSISRENIINIGQYSKAESNIGGYIILSRMWYSQKNSVIWVSTICELLRKSSKRLKPMAMTKFKHDLLSYLIQVNSEVRDGDSCMGGLNISSNLTSASRMWPGKLASLIHFCILCSPYLLHF